MVSPKVVFHRDGEVSVGGVRVGFVSGTAHKWFFTPSGLGHTPNSDEGPFKNRSPIKKRARDLYAVIEEQREAAKRAR